MVKSILIAEDEKPIAESLAYCLQKEGFTTFIANDGKEALTSYEKEGPSLILLDLMLPIISGQEVCKTIRKHSDVPIIMLTAKDGELDKIVGLEIGADDYITKPFSMRELLARINAVLRRSTDRQDNIVVGPFEFDEEKHEIRFNDKTLDLPLKQFNILKTLLLNKDRVVSREDLLKTVWGEDFFGDEKTLDVHIRRLRQKIEKDSTHPTHLKTIRGVGYRLLTDSQS
ncbi:hypothetical protein LCGC14_1490060 [marine sediment metagenome]|uniref:Uncharacterized protein n=1 Tax=marine sediment metagenome TaxID=412755 RepID=A0A0F9LMG6_9ZZZZ|nr:response regulator transcription factor [Actinomycetota bacterium]